MLPCDRPLALTLLVCALGGVARGAAPGEASQVRCEGGEAWACLSWGRDLHAQGDLAGAQEAYSKACQLSPDDACRPLGELLMAQGELGKAEVPLRLACDSGSVPGCRALLELYRRRGWPGDALDARARREELSLLLKPLSEFTAWYRPGLLTPHGFALAFTFSPMQLLRQLVFGAQAGINGGARWEINGQVGYQRYLGNFAPYAMGLLGAMPATGRINVGADAGLKWYPFGSILSVNALVGFSLASSFHAGIGLGVDEGLFSGTGGPS